MHSGLALLGNLLPLVAACLFIIALVPARRLLSELPVGEASRYWRVLIALICVFILGCVGYASTSWSNHYSIQDIIVPVVLLCVAIFVLLVCLMSLQTAREVILIGELRHQAMTDPLMGIFNRRYLMQRLQEECLRARRYGLDLSLLLIDIDHFKRVNDSHGHQVGDCVLVGLGRIIVDTLRETDIVARYGGEELVVIAPNTNVSVASELAERLRRTVEDITLNALCGHAPSAPRVPLTVSIGVAGLHAGSDDPDSIISSADKALYEAKTQGRNRVCVSRIQLPSAEKGDVESP